MAVEDGASTFADERAIEQALIRFARAMDDRDWITLAAILADDAVGDLGTGELHGSAAIIELIRSYLDHCGTTQHMLGNILITINGDTATSRAYVHDLHLSTRQPQTTFHTLGDYHDKWECREGEWRLVKRVKDNRGIVGSLEVFDA